MKKRQKRLALNTQTIRDLKPDNLVLVAGGKSALCPPTSGFGTCFPC